MNQTMRLLKLRCLSRGGIYTGEVLKNGARIGVRVVGKKTVWELQGDRMPAKDVAEYMEKHVTNRIERAQPAIKT